MNQKTATRLTLAGLCILILMGGFLTYSVVSLRSGIQQHLERIARMKISEAVTNVSGRTATIMTTINDGEDVTSWLQRHKDAVDEFKTT